MRLTRRKLAASLAASAAGMAHSQTAAPEGPDDAEVRAARDRIRAAGEALARQEIPQSTEPAFQFKA